MSFPPVTALLRHRSPSLLVDAIEDWDGTTLTCVSASRSWHWTQLLDAAAQAAGLIVGLRHDGLARFVVARYDEVTFVPAYEGSIRWVAKQTRRIAHMRQFQVHGMAAAARLLSTGLTLVATGGPTLSKLDGSSGDPGPPEHGSA